MSIKKFPYYRFLPNMVSKRNICYILWFWNIWKSIKRLVPRFPRLFPKNAKIIGGLFQRVKNQFFVVLSKNILQLNYLNCLIRFWKLWLLSNMSFYDFMRTIWNLPATFQESYFIWNIHHWHHLSQIWCLYLQVQYFGDI